MRTLQTFRGCCILATDCRMCMSRPDVFCSRENCISGAQWTTRRTSTRLSPPLVRAHRTSRCGAFGTSPRAPDLASYSMYSIPLISERFPLHRRALCTEPPNARKLCSADLLRVCPNHSCAQQLGRVEFAAPVWIYGRLLVASADAGMLTPPVAPGAILTTEACCELGYRNCRKSSCGSLS